MTTTAQYASIPKNGVAFLSTANPNRDGTGAVVSVVQAGAVGLRVDGLSLKALSTTTAGLIRLFLFKGRPLGPVASVTFTGTTAVMTLVNDHGLSTGQLISTTGFYPDEYNLNDAVLTVSGAKTLSFVMGTAPTANAWNLGSASTTLATATARLLGEIPVTAVTPSATVGTFALGIGSATGTEKVLFPLILQAGWTLRASTEKAEAFHVIPTFAGDFS